MDEQEFKDGIRKVYGNGVTPDFSARAFRACSSLAAYGHLRATDTDVDTDKAFVRETCKGLTENEMLAVSIGLQKYSLMVKSEVERQEQDTTDTNESRH